MDIDMNAMYGFAKAMSKGRGINPNDLDDVVQDALCDALGSGIDDQKAIQGFVMIGILRFTQNRSRKYKSPAVKPGTINGLTLSVMDNGPIMVEIMDEFDAVMMDVGSLSESLRDTVLLSLKSLNNHEIAAIRGVRHRTVAVDKCRAVDALRGLRLNRLM